MAPRPSRTVETAWLFVILAHLAWGYLSPGGKLLLSWWPEWTLNAVRMGAATLLLMAWFGRTETLYGLKALLVDRHLVILGVVGIGCTFWFYLWSLRFIEATAAAVLVFLAPYLTALLARATLGEPIGWHLLAAATAALGGAWLALFGATADPFGTGSRTVWFGLGLNMVSVVLWAVYTVHLRVVAPRYPLGRLTIATFTAATVFFGVVAVIVESGRLDVSVAFSWPSWGFMAAYVLFPSVAAYLLYAAALRTLPAGPVTLLLGLELLAASVIAHLLLDERFPPLRIAGLALTTASVVWFVWMQSRLEARVAAA